MDCHLIERLVMDRHWIGTGFGNGLAPDWQLNAQWIDIRLPPDWRWIGNGSVGIGSHSAPDWLQIGTGLAPDWRWIGDGLSDW